MGVPVGTGIREGIGVGVGVGVGEGEGEGEGRLAPRQPIQPSGGPRQETAGV